MVVKLMGSVMKKMAKPEVPGEPTTRECPECLSIIPIKAKRLLVTLHGGGGAEARRNNFQ